MELDKSVDTSRRMTPGSLLEKTLHSDHKTPFTPIDLPRPPRPTWTPSTHLDVQALVPEDLFMLAEYRIRKSRVEGCDDLHILAQQRCFVLGCANWDGISDQRLLEQRRRHTPISRWIGA